MLSTTTHKFLGLLFLFLLCPFLALPLIVHGIRIGDRKCYFLLTLFLGLIAYMLAPISDLGAHYMLSEYFSNMTWDTFKLYLINSRDYITQISEWGIHQIGLPFEVLPLTITIITFTLIHSIFHYCIHNSSKCYTSKEIFIRYIWYLLLFPFILLVSGIRFGFAVVIVLYAFHLLIERRKFILAICLLLISCLIHFSIIYFLLPTIILLYIPLNRYSITLLLIVSFTANTFLSDIVSEHFIENEFTGSAYLGDGTWGNTTGKEFKSTALIYHWGQRILLTPLLSILLLHFRQLKKWGNILVSFILLFFTFIDYFTITQRLTVCILTFSIFFLLKIETNGYSLTKRSQKVLITCAIICSLFDLWTHRNFIILSNYHRLLQPVPVTLIQTYSKDWVIKNNT